MQNPTSPNERMFLFSTEEEFFNKIVEKDNPFRKLKEIINFTELVAPLRNLYSDLGTKGIDIEKGFKTLLVQFWEDYSDRQMEQALKENMSIRWFCGFGLNEKTPEFTYFCKLRKRIGTKNIVNIFNSINENLKEKGLFGNFFTFIDASSIISKTALWEERDSAIRAGEEKLNNSNVKKYAKDKDARWGAKNKKNFWYGYKRHNSVDMRYGLINKLAITSGEILDFKTVKNICPKQGMVFADKLYDCKESNFWIKVNKCHIGTIKKNNNPLKNKDLDSWLSKIRMPFEGTFSKLRKRTKFRGLKKVTMQCFFESICYNLKKAVTILPTEIHTT